MSWNAKSPNRPLVLMALALCASGLTCCAPSRASVAIAPALARAPDALTQRCGDPQALPETGLSANAAARLWGRDRMSLARCAARHGALARHVRGQEAALEAAQPSP